MVEVLIIAGSMSDKKIVEKVESVLKGKAEYDIEYCSAHREPDRLKEIIEKASVDVFVCVAGLSAALPGFVAAYSDKPVIGVPVDVKFNGLDSLLSMVQMPKGVPVATVGVDNGQNAGHLALRILALKKA